MFSGGGVIYESHKLSQESPPPEKHLGVQPRLADGFTSKRRVIGTCSVALGIKKQEPVL